MLSVTPSTTTTTPGLRPPGKMRVYHCSFSAYTYMHTVVVHMCNQHVFSFT